MPKNIIKDNGSDNPLLGHRGKPNRTPLKQQEKWDG